MFSGMSADVNLKDLHGDDPIYLGRGEDGSLLFRECHVDYRGLTRRVNLAEKLALALIERCRRAVAELGVGWYVLK